MTRLVNCGNAGSITGFPSEGYLQFSSDVTGSVEMSAAAMHQGGTLVISASGTVTEINVERDPEGARFQSEQLRANGVRIASRRNASTPIGIHLTRSRR